MQRLGGKEVADKIVEDLKIKVEELKGKGISPKLAILRVGAREDDLAYERGVLKRFESAGVEVEVTAVDAGISQEELDKTFDGINNDSDAHGYVFKITGSNGKSYYLNDWSGNRFDGEFKQVTCTDYTIGSLKDGITPSVEMIGNYVVFRDVESPNFDVTIECVDSNFGTQERNDLPVVSAVQIVAGVNREKDIAVGGDHDKDFVAGDDASLHFDLDIPFAGDENIRDYQNRLISAKSMPVSGSANNDKIWTGKDRDVVVGGEGNDQIDAGAGDDVVIGNTARNLYVEHNNPVGVFRPNVNIVLEDNDYNVAEPRPYLDGQGGNRDQIRSMVQNGQIEGISLDYQNMANDTVYGGYNNKDLVFNGNVSWENLPKELASDPFFGVQEDEVHAMPTPPAPAEEEPGGNEEPANGNEEPVNGGNDPVNGNEDPANGDEPQNTDDCSRTYIFPVAFAPEMVVTSPKFTTRSFAPLKFWSVREISFTVFCIMLCYCGF